MFSLLWIPLTVAASFLQVARNAFQRGLLPKSGPWAATLVRFLFGLPFAASFALCAALVTPGASARFTPLFWAGALSGAVSQVVATACLLVAMRRAGFAVATSVQQSSLPLAAVLDQRFFHDRLGPLAWTGVALTSAALAVLTWPRQASGPQPVSGGLFGLLSGLTFGYSLNAYRQAAVALDPVHPIFAAVCTVAVTQAVPDRGADAAELLIWDQAALRARCSPPGANRWRRAFAAPWRQAAGSRPWPCRP